VPGKISECPKKPNGMPTKIPASDFQQIADDVRNQAEEADIERNSDANRGQIQNIDHVNNTEEQRT
jgi:hypothetical protein